MYWTTAGHASTKFLVFPLPILIFITHVLQDRVSCGVLDLFISALKFYLLGGRNYCIYDKRANIFFTALSSLSVFKDMEKDAEGQIKSVMLMGLPATSLEVKRNFSHGLYQNADGEKNGRE